MKANKYKRPVKKKSKLAEWYEDLNTLKIKKDSIVNFDHEIKK
jgi:hypothetical protein